MYTVFDYIKYYKNTSLDDVSWNIIDNLICAILAYMPIEPFDEEKTLEEVCNLVDKATIPKGKCLMVPKVKDVTKLLHNAKRYDDLRISKFVQIVNDDMQFGAMTLTINDIKIISFEGSDGSVTGWRENFRLAYKYPVYSQIKAYHYLKDNIYRNDKMVYVVGHSKGGNLAMSACYNLNEKQLIKIKEIDNFDGPGFLKEQKESEQFKRISKKIVNVVPKGSYIGVLLHNNLKYITVNSNEKGVYVHHPTSWEVFGTTFPKTEMTRGSKYIYRITTTGFDELNRKQTGIFIEAIFKDNFESCDSKMQLSHKQVIRAFKTSRENNLRVRHILGEMLSLVFTRKKDKSLK